MVIKALLVLGAFLFMEGVAWFSHKYIMHGFMWIWHEDHHRHHKSFFEKNDYFAVVFASIAITNIVIGGLYEDFWFLLWVGIGITCYGAFYFIFHDVIVHRRIRIKFVAKGKYMKRIMNAHYMHHKVHTKEGAEAFGFLYAPKKYKVGKDSRPTT